MATDLKSIALTVARRLLRALIRIMLEHGVMHREFVQLSKEIYVEVAQRAYGLRGRPTNIARMALLTGLDRKEITRIKKDLTTSEPEREVNHRQDRIARVLAGWHQDERYSDENGKPLAIAFDGEAPSFTELVKRYGGDVPAITIQRELLRVKAVRAKHSGALEVLRRNYRLDTAEPEALFRAGTVLEDMSTTVAHNLYHGANQSSRFEAEASNTRIAASAKPEYEAFVRAESQAFLERVDDWLTQREVPPSAGDEEVLRLGLGMYWIESDDTEGVPR